MKLRVNPCSHGRVDGDTLTVFVNDANKRVRTSRGAMPLLSVASSPTERSRLVERFGEDLVSSFEDHGVLVADGDFEGVRLWERYNWKLPLLYYEASKDLCFVDERRDDVEEARQTLRKAHAASGNVEDLRRTFHEDREYQDSQDAVIMKNRGHVPTGHNLNQLERVRDALETLMKIQS